MDLRIVGSMDVKGGVYDNVKIMGSGDIYGDIECINYLVMGSGDLYGNLKAQSLNISGSGDIEGNVCAEEIIINGSGDIIGNVECRSVKINGSGDIEGDVRAQDISIRGSGDIEGNVKSQQVSISGSGNIEGNCECERFIGKGSFTVEGFLNSKEVEINIVLSCEVGEIAANRVTVTRGNRMKNGILNKVISAITGGLECRVIEANEIYLENSEIEVVRGINIIIGEGCEIGTIEYRDKCEINPNSRVNNVVKVGNDKNGLTIV